MSLANKRKDCLTTWNIKLLYTFTRYQPTEVVNFKVISISWMETKTMDRICKYTKWLGMLPNPYSAIFTILFSNKLKTNKQKNKQLEIQTDNVSHMYTYDNQNLCENTQCLFVNWICRDIHLEIPREIHPFHPAIHLENYHG